MAWDMMAAGNPAPQILRLGDRGYWLMPMPDGRQSVQQEHDHRSELQLFDSESLKDVEEFSYDNLDNSKKRIRLLQLKSGMTQGLEIFCELKQADYDNTFHIPTEPMKKPPKETEEEEWTRVKKKEIKYEALSWCWGTGLPIYAVLIERGGHLYKLSVRKELALALKYLRLPNKTRTLWVDAICINQKKPEERNHQVQMMSRVYTRAEEVCIWLGEDSHESRAAIDFIRHDIVGLNNFDAICSDKKYAEKWRALMMLMQREWFSRRWVIQELALASKAKVYCGPDSISWKEFAIAVELFVQVETSTHRLSEAMQNDEKFRHVPGWFEYVSELGASLLVQATGKVFRAQGTPMDDAPGESQNKEQLHSKREFNTIDPLDRRSLLSLEYLVSTMFIFKATEPRDAVYALLAIARDAAPLAKSTFGKQDESLLIMSLFDRYLEEKPFLVDYSRPYSDVCRDFVEFIIKRKAKVDPVQALDILCRPWALEEPKSGKSIRLSSTDDSPPKRKRLIPEKKCWNVRICPVIPEKREEKEREKSATKLRYAKKEENSSITFSYLKGDTDSWVEDKRSTKQYREDCKKRTWDDSWKLPTGWEKYKAYFPERQADEDGSGSTPAKIHVEKKDEKDVPLPGWVARTSQAPFDLYHHPGIHIPKTGRANADPLVGQPHDGHRNYSAAQTDKIDLTALRFRKRPSLGHYSLYVTGIELDEVIDVRDASQGGNIPKSWLDLGGWEEPYIKDPPDEFWRTIVADRGRENRNPPYYFARACRESVHKGGIASGRVNTTALINNEQNSIVAEFCRRVHAVIWNRSLFRTKNLKLGLANGVQKGDIVCILYGCTVPVILKRHEKAQGEVEKEQIEDQVEALRSCIKKMEDRRERKAKYIEKLKTASSKEKNALAKARYTANTALEIDQDIKERLERAAEDAKKEGERKAKEQASRSGAEQDGEAGEHQEGGASANPTQEDISQPNDGAETSEEDAHVCQDHWYEFKGESYIHGMMDGEALREKFYQTHKDHLFELR